MTFGKPRRHFSECSSTNDIAKTWALETAHPAPHGALVTADYQSAGRGRRGRQWEAQPAQSALMSFIMRPSIKAEHVWQLGFMTALAAADALETMGVGIVRLKWPNDVLLNNNKAAGILIETVLSADPAAGLKAVIAGIGINVNQTEFAETNYVYPPTSLQIATGKIFEIESVTHAMARSLEHWTTALTENGFAPIHAGWEQRLARGAAVRNSEQAGELIGIAPGGHALVRLPNNVIQEWALLEANAPAETKSPRISV